MRVVPDALLKANYVNPAQIVDLSKTAPGEARTADHCARGQPLPAHPTRRFLARVPPGKETGSLRRRCCAWETLPGWMSYVACRVLRHVMCYMLCVACSMLQRFVRRRSWRGCVAG